MSDETCFCGMAIKDHTAWRSCTSPRAMPEPPENDDPCGTKAHNAWLDSVLEDIEFEPLREFMDKLREVPK